MPDQHPKLLKPGTDSLAESQGARKNVKHQYLGAWHLFGTFLAPFITSVPGTFTYQFSVTLFEAYVLAVPRLAKRQGFATLVGMEDQDLQEWCEQLRRELADGRECGRSKKWRCPPELRSRVLSFARVCRERGEPYLDIAVRLGMVESTLTRWLRTEKIKDQPGFRSVSIVPSAGDETIEESPASSYRLFTPHGYRVEGLDVQTLAYLLRVVG